MEAVGSAKLYRDIGVSAEGARIVQWQHQLFCGGIEGTKCMGRGGHQKICQKWLKIVNICFFVFLRREVSGGCDSAIDGGRINASYAPLVPPPILHLLNEVGI